MTKSKIRFILALMMAMVIAITSLAIPVSATENVEIIDSLPAFGENYIPSSMINYSIDDKMVASDGNAIYDVVDIVVSKSNIVIDETTMSEFVDVFGKLRNGRYVNITDDVVCTFSNPKIASWIFGRIIADDKGHTIMSCEYNGIVKNVDIVVKNYICERANAVIINVDNIAEKGRLSLSSITRQDAVDTAKNMVDMKWTPENDLLTWFGTNRDPFKAGTEVTGMPYTQYRLQTTKDEFLYALENETDFYTRVAYGDWLVPKYGNDCSGFLSICWNLTDGSGRTRPNTTDFINRVEDNTYSRLKYMELQPGDALYKESGGKHVILVYEVEISSSYAGGGRVRVYEQTDIKARRSTLTFTDLSNMKYYAFTMF